jgi:hypothetical protein
MTLDDEVKQAAKHIAGILNPVGQRIREHHYELGNQAAIKRAERIEGYRKTAHEVLASLPAFLAKHSLSAYTDVKFLELKIEAKSKYPLLVSKYSVNSDPTPVTGYYHTDEYPGYEIEHIYYFGLNIQKDLMRARYDVHYICSTLQKLGLRLHIFGYEKDLDISIRIPKIDDKTPDSLFPLQ